MKIEEIKLEFESFLNQIKESFTKELEIIIKTLPFEWDEDEAEENLKALCFEYEYDDLNLACWPVNEDYELIAEPIYLPKNLDFSKAHPNSKWQSLFPEELADGFLNYIDEHVEQEGKIRQDFDLFKYQLFEQWFCDCWKQANKGNKIQGLFSIHEAFFKTDLNRQITLQNKEIRKLLKS